MLFRVESGQVDRDECFFFCETVLATRSFVRSLARTLARWRMADRRTGARAGPSVAVATSGKLNEPIRA